MEETKKEETKKYGDLSQEQLQALLSRIDIEDDIIEEYCGEHEDDSVVSADGLQDIAAIIAEEEADMTEDEKNTSNAWAEQRDFIYVDGKLQAIKSDTTLRSDINERIRTALKKRFERERKKKQFINKFAFEQTDIDLSAVITEEQMRLVLKRIYDENNAIAERVADYINKKIARLLAPFIPYDLRKCRRKYPNSVMRHLGFLYIHKNGEIKFLAQPDIPAYLEQNSEMSLLNELPQEHLDRIDTQIMLYNKRKQSANNRQLTAAMNIAKSRQVTFLRILKMNPMWFWYTYEVLTNKKIKYDE